MGDRFIVLTWHSILVHENTYEQNDLIAFSTDLEILDRNGWTILPLETAWQRARRGQLPERTAVLTLDDGSIMDYHPFDHPTCGPQVSAFERLREFARSATVNPAHVPHASAFVIASPEARAEIDRTVTLNLGVWPEGWWAAANRSGLMAIESHSWDHNHESISRSLQRDNRRGDFSLIATEAECHGEVARASEYIEQVSRRRPRFLAYPYGQCSDYLRSEYLPRFGDKLGLQAALGCEPRPVTPDRDCWNLPRFVSKSDWHTPEEFEALLRSV